MIYIRTTAYNASRTLRRAVESVLRQTYGEFEYYLIDNGSVDHGQTRKIIEEYARRDSRIKPFFNVKNHVWKGNEEASLLPHNIGAEDYFCLLDADDEYALTFLADMLEFMERNYLDIAACGSDFIRAEDSVITGQRLFSQDVIIEGQQFEALFPAYYQFMRTVWGKLFKGKTLRNTILDTKSPKIPRVYGNDTFFTMCAFRDAKRAGVLGKVLHRYYIFPKSVSHVFRSDRSKCDRIIRNAMIDFLRPYGQIRQRNMDFIDAVHADACKDSLMVILNATISTLEKMRWIQELLSDEGAVAVFQSTSPEVAERADLIRKMILNWIREQKERETARGAELTAEIVMLLLPRHETFSFLRTMWMERPELIRKLGKKKWVERHLLTIPVLQNVSMSLAFATPDAICLIMQGRWAEAWEQFTAAGEVELQEEDRESWCLLGQNLAALAEDPSGYIYFKKVWISYLIDHERVTEAEAELEEFIDILPDDEDFARLKERAVQLRDS